MRIYLALFLGSALAVMGCTPRAEDHRPIRVRVADQFIKTPQRFTVGEVRLAEVPGENPIFCIKARMTGIFGISGDEVSIYKIERSLNGTTYISAWLPNDVVGIIGIAMRCPQEPDKYKPFPEYETLKAQREKNGAV